MKLLLDSFWRAGAYLFLPRVIGLTLLPLLVAGGLAVGMGFLFWNDAQTLVRTALDDWSLTSAMLRWIEVNLDAHWRAVIGPLIVVALAVPFIVVVSLLLVAWMMTPAMANLVRERRFPGLEQRRGASFVQAVAWSLGCAVLALLMLLGSMPLWLIPPLVVVLPPLIWGWLTRQVMSFDVLAETASATERRTLLAAHRWPLLVIGVITGYLGVGPSLIWAGGVAVLILAPIMVVVAVWLYTLLFAFSSLWFAHYALAALDAQRRAQTVEVEPIDPPAAPVVPSSSQEVIAP